MLLEINNVVYNPVTSFQYKLKVAKTPATQISITGVLKVYTFILFSFQDIQVIFQP